MPADPYRTNDAAPRRTETSLRSGTPASALPLGVIAITFLMPFASPLRESTVDLGSFFLLTPTFASAAVLCAAIVFTWVTKRSATRLALVAMAWSVLAAGWVVAVSFAEKEDAWVLFAASAMCAPLYGLAWSSRGLRRLALLVDAYLFASLPVAALVFVSAEYYGAVFFLFAYATLALMRVFVWLGSARRWATRSAAALR